ncbi:MAG: hypothetical protein WC477_01490 [Patescibacteria group bacterium]
MNEHEQAFSDAVLLKIKDEHITPKPRWEFLLKDSAIWIAGGASLLVGGLAVSVIINLLTSEDFAIAVARGANPLAMFFASIPYFWILFFVAFLFITRYNLIYTKRGYAYTLPVFAVASIAISGVLGVIFYGIGIGPDIESELTERIPAYVQIAHPRAILWSHPERGMIAGVVVGVDDDHDFILQDFRSTMWTVEADASNTLPVTVPGMRVRCLGDVVGPNEFRAMQILPWKPPAPSFFRYQIPQPRPRPK